MANWRGVAAVCGGFLVHLTLGTVYTSGNLNPYMTSYIRAYSVPSTMTYADGTWIFASATAAQGFSMFAGGLMATKIGPRATTLIGGWFLSLGVLLTYVTIKVSYACALVTYGVMFGLGCGLAYATPLALGMMWFPNNRGLVTGIIVAGFGGGSMIFNEIQTVYINPDNHSPDSPPDLDTGEIYFSNRTDSQILRRVPSCFILLGVSYMVLQLIGTLLLFSPSESGPIKCSSQAHHDTEDKALLMRGSDEADPPLQRYDQHRSAVRRLCCVDTVAEELTISRVLQTRAFYTLWFMFFVNGQAVVFITSLYKTYGQTFIHNDHLLTALGSVSSVFNSLGRIMWGYLADRYSFKAAMLALCTGMTVFMLTLITCPHGGAPMFFIWVCSIYLLLSGNYALFPTVAAKSFGNTHVAVTHGCLFTSQVITSPLGAVLVSNLMPLIGWFGMFALVAGFALIGWFLALSFNVKTVVGKNV